MTSRRLGLLVLSLALLALTPLAYASPPDPSWIRGLYDDGDFDDVVVLLTSAPGVVEPFPLHEVQPHLVTVDSALQGDDGSAPILALSSNHARAPPVS